MRLLLLALLLAAGCGPAPPPAQAPPSDVLPVADDSAALRRDAESYAADVGVSVDEAARRLTIQNSGDLGQLQERLATERPATFGGLWVVHQPEYGAVVAFTEAADSTLALYVPAGGFPFPVRAVAVAYSAEELRAAQVLAGAALRRLGVPNESGVYLMDNRVEVVVEDAAPVEAALAQGYLWLHPAVEVVEGEFMQPE